MKLSFDGHELTWLYTTIVTLGEVVAASEDKSMAHQVAKLRYKLYGVPALVHLTRPQRAILGQLVAYRLSQLGQGEVPTQETAVLRGLARKLEVAA